MDDEISPHPDLLPREKELAPSPLERVGVRVISSRQLPELLQTGEHDLLTYYESDATRRFTGDGRSVAPMLGLLWSPLAAVTSSWQGKINAQIAVSAAAASIVPDRPRIILQVYKRNYSHHLIYRSGVFAINFLRHDQLDLIKEFGFVSGKDRDKLAGRRYSLRSSGCPVLDQCWGYLDCRVVNAMDGGDLTSFLAEVLEGKVVEAEAGPLWWRDARRQLPPAWREEWDRKLAGEIEYSRQRMDSIDYTPYK